MTKLSSNESNHALRTLLTFECHTIDEDTEGDVEHVGDAVLRAWKSHENMRGVFRDIATSEEKGCGLIFLRGKDGIAHMLCWIKLNGSPFIIDPTCSEDERIFTNNNESIELFETVYDKLGCEVSTFFVVWCAGGPQSMHVPTTSPMRVLYDETVEVKSEAANN